MKYFQIVLRNSAGCELYRSDTHQRYPDADNLVNVHMATDFRHNHILLEVGDTVSVEEVQP